MFASTAHGGDESVDMLDFLLQRDDADMSWTLGGIDVRPGRDPDGNCVQTFILNKWSNRDCYEVFKVTDSQIQLRYEVVRMAGDAGTDNWIRRFEELDGEGPAPGAVWVKRHMTPGGEGVLSRFRQDHFIFDPATRSYTFYDRGSGRAMQTHQSIVWAENNWRENNHSGFELNPCLRLISQWQTDGMIFETYDYARGKGLISWRWLERISTLTPMSGDESGNIFHCELGFVHVEPAASEDRPPVVHQYDPQSRHLGRRLAVVPFKSYWRPELGEQWYVVYRDLSREGPLVKKRERIGHEFSLPEWKDKPGATLRDLPYVNTHPPR